MIVKNAWYVGAWGTEIGATPLARRICDEPIVFYRDAQGTVAALADFCCHRGAPLSCGKVIDTGLECGYHGMVYGRDGTVVAIPGQSHVPSKARVRSYPVVERDAVVWIWMGAAQDADASTIRPLHPDMWAWPHRTEVYHVKANAMLIVDNLMDLTHLAYVHTSTIGGNVQGQLNAIMDEEHNDRGLKYTRWILDSHAPPSFQKALNFAGNVDRWGEFDYVAPGTIAQWAGSVDANTGARDRNNRVGGFQLRTLHALTPETETSSFYLWSIANGHQQDNPKATDDLFNDVTIAFHEDIAIIEQQQQRLLEFGENDLVNMRNDGARVHMRRIIEAMAKRETANPVRDSAMV